MVPQPLILRTALLFGASTTWTVPLPEPLRNLIGGFVLGVTSSAAAPTSIKDDCNNTYSQVVTNNFFGASVTSIWYCQKIQGNPQRLTVTFAANNSGQIAGVFYDQPLLSVASGSSSGNTSTPGVSSLAQKSGEDVLFAVANTTNLTARPANTLDLATGNTVSFVYGAFPNIRKAVWTMSVSGGCSACVATFKPVPLTWNYWMAEAVYRFFGSVPPSSVSASWSDTLTWTDAAAASEVEAFYSDTVTWTPTIPPPGDDDFTADTLTWTDSFLPTGSDASLADTLTWTDSDDLAGVDVPALTDTVTFADEDDATGYDWTLADTLTWSDTYAVAGYDWTLADTLTWTDAAVLASVSAFTADTLTWTDAALAAGADVALADTLTWTPLIVLSTDVALADTLTFTGSDRVIEDGDMPDDTLAFADSFQGLPQIETVVVDLLLWTDQTEEDQFVQQTVTWLDLFFYDGEVFPPIDAAWADTLTWDMRPSGMATPTADTLTWGDSFDLPEPTVNMGDTLTWQSSFGADPNLLGAARYRR